MKSSHKAQKILFGIAAISGVLALLGVGIGTAFFHSLSLNAAWIFAISLPLAILTCIATSALFLLIRMFQGGGLGKPYIFSAMAVLAGYGTLVAINIVRSRANHDGPRQRSETELASLTTNSPAFFDRLQQLAPLDDGFRGQSESLIGYQAFRRPNPEFASNYFARATALVPPGPWINRSLLFGIQELDPAADPARLAHLAAVIQLVARHQPALLQTPFVQREQTNTLRGFIEDDARSRTPTNHHGPVLQLLPPSANR
jgi:hypothetical protein